MKRFLVSTLAVVLSFVAAARAWADDKPVVAVTLPSYDALVKDVAYVAKLIGMEGAEKAGAFEEAAVQCVFGAVAGSALRGVGALHCGRREVVSCRSALQTEEMDRWPLVWHAGLLGSGR